MENEIRVTEGREGERARIGGVGGFLSLVFQSLRFLRQLL